jgi:isoquinoline 1-oxidoreductase beta subunit
MIETSLDSGALSRRRFIQYGAAATGGLVIAISLPGCGKPAAQGPRELKNVAVNAWLRIGTDDSIGFLCDRSEMGQGVYTALPMLLAEELGVKVERIQVEFAPAAPVYANSFLGVQITGGSTSVREAWEKLRKAGAQAREMLVAAACKDWDIPVTGCRVEDGVIISTHGKRLSFGAVADSAMQMPVPAAPQLKPRSAYTVIGRDQRRLDTPAKVDGSAVYGIDVKLPGMLYGALLQPPQLGGSVRSFDAAASRAMPGVKAVVQTSSGVAVVADSWWQARKARDALKVEWNAGPNAALDSAAIIAGLRKAAPQPGLVARTEGDAEAALATAAKSGGKVVRADYELPLLAHATMEPQNCTASVTADGCELHVPTQIQTIAQAVAATAAGLKPEQVKVHTTFIGGGFGRRLEVDFIPAAVEASKAVGKPVKMLWTREDDMTHDAYRPPAFDQAAGAFDAQGKLVAWKLHLTSPSITARMFPSPDSDKTVDAFAVEAAANYPYDVPNVLVRFNRHEIGINVGYTRSVSHALNCFVAESFMDELALAANQDPGKFRLGLLGKQPRYRRVLENVIREAHYGVPPAGRFHGLAVMEGYGTYMAQVAEISLEKGKVKVHHVWCSVDCGQVVNPSIVVAQVQGSVVFGLTATLWGDITLKGGQVVQRNFDHYRLLAITEMPRVDVDLIDSKEAPGGIGEPATALVAPAVCNAVFSATKRRVRALPLARQGLA